MSATPFLTASRAAELDLLGLARRAPIHFMGVCGAGMASLAEYVLRSGGKATGCDARPAGIPPALRSLGLAVVEGHDPAHVEGAAALVTTAAVPAEHEELAAAAERGIPVLKRAAALGALVNRGRVVAVAGTHGKTTTTAMIATLLEEAGMDPTAFVGGRLPGWGGGLRAGGPLFVVEADEYDRSFLSLRPDVAVVTTIEPDHMEIYGDLDALHDAFLAFLEPVPDTGLIALCTDDPGVAALAERLPAERVLTFGLGPGAMLSADRLELVGGTTHFHVTRSGRSEGDFTVAAPGAHNIRNALGALAAAQHLGADPELVRRGLAHFAGVERRFERLTDAGGVTVIDDYAHHPTEVAATMSAARARFGGRRLVAVFQPHLYSRTREHWRAFGSALAAADEVWVTDVYPARESPIEGVTGELVATAARQAGVGATTYRPEITGLEDALAQALAAGDVCLLMGAGDITDHAHALARRLEEAGT